MSTRIVCPRCDGRVEIPEQPSSNVVCPFCRQFLVSVDPRTGAIWRQGRPWKQWLLRAGSILMAIGLIGFATSFVAADMRDDAHLDTTVMAGVGNPLFFAGFPTGLLMIAIRLAGRSGDRVLSRRHPAE